MRPRFAASCLLLCLFACTQEAAPPALLAVEHPDFSRLQTEQSRRIRELRKRLESADGARGEAAIWGELGELYQVHRLDHPAVACLENARRLDPSSYRWAYGLAWVRERLGDDEEAAEAWREALAIRDGEPAALLRLAEVELRLGELDAARRHFEDVLWNPELAAAGEYGLGRVEAARGHPEAAISHLEKTLDLQPEATVVHYALGLAHRDLGHLEEAQRYLTAGASGRVSWPDADADRLEALSTSPHAVLRRAGRALARNELETAVALYRSALEDDPRNPEARRNLALALQRSGRLDEALAELEEALGDSPDDVWLLFDLGNVLQAKGDLPAALARYRAATKIAPRFAAAHFNLANAQMRAGYWQAALGSLDRVLEIDPTHRKARYLSGMALYQSGRRERGEAVLIELLRDEPGDWVARAGLVKILRQEGRNEEALDRIAEGEPWIDTEQDRLVIERLRRELEQQLARN